MREYDVVVIGAGNGGIGAAVTLAKQGLKPLVLEQHNLPGGCATSFVRGRFEFDASLHAFFYDVVFKPAWGSLNLTEEIVKTKDNFTFGYADEATGEKVLSIYPAGMKEFVGAFAKEHPYCLPKMQEFVGLCGEAMQGLRLMGNPEELEKQCPNFFKVRNMTMKQIYEVLELPIEIQSIMDQFWWYLGPGMQDFPFIRFAPMLFMVLTQSIYYPKHTCHGYLAEFEKIIRENGGDVWYNTRATEIVTENNKVIGVKTNYGDFIKASQVISNASPRVTLEDLVKESEKRNELLEKQKSLHENFTFSIVYLGLNASAEELGIKSHHIFLNETNNHEKIYNASGTWDGPYSVGILCPNVTIPDFSPEGTCVLSLSVPMQGFVLEGMTQEEYFKAKDKFAKRAIEVTSDLLGVNLFDYIEEIVVATPATLSRYANLRNGALGYAITLEDLAKNGKFTAELNNDAIEGLSYVGQFATGIGYASNVKGMGIAAEVAKKMKGVN